jgi:hypothetical protein
MRVRLTHASLVAGIATFAFAAAASAHIERPSYWPDPAPDTSVQPPAGGAVPAARSLASALDRKAPGDTRVVCQADSLTLLKASIARAQTEGYNIRPSDHRILSPREAKKLLKVNRQLKKLCKYSEIQPAVTASGNNDRVVVMPGLYTEPTSRSAKTFDPGCARYKRNTEFGDPGALSYAYHVHCPNDQNLIAVMGRATGPGNDPDPPLWNRHGIPNIGPCVRCNLQLEGSGVSADDVIVDAGDFTVGNKGPHRAVKDVAIRADRADGFVLRNITTRHAKEHGIYVIETDGYLLDRFKSFYNGLYGTLTFVEDHGVQQNCETVGHPDSGIYPGAALESGVQRPAGTDFRYNQEIRWCDSHHNLAGYSGTDGNAVYIHDNNFYGNALGIQTDIATAAGHPGFPGDSMLVERNNIFSNNFNPYDEGSDVPPAFPFPVGTGMWIAGGNHHTIRRNFIYDNWRRGTMVFSIPDALVCGPVAENEQAGCSFTSVSTSHYNQQYENVMGRSPDGHALRNGVDFWWDAFPGNRGNCWYWNRGPAPITSSPSPVPNCTDGRDPAMSIGTGNVVNEIELLSCLAAFETRNFDRDTTTCPWLFSPEKPGRQRNDPISRTLRARAPEVLGKFCARNRATTTCRAYDGWLTPRWTRTATCSAVLGTCSPTTPARRAAARMPGRHSNFDIQLFTCGDWRRAGATTRGYAIQRLREITGGPVVGEGIRGYGAIVPDDQAYEMFDNWCGRRMTSNFTLYKLYGQAAGFIGAAR